LPMHKPGIRYVHFPAGLLRRKILIMKL
jgi:hypothetical protein